MRKIFVLFILIILGTNTSFGKEISDSSINFDGKKYNLLYSTKNKEFGGYLNEYFKAGETYHMWSEMVAVHHFPNAYSPIDQVKAFREYLGSMNCPSALTFDDRKNSAIIDFVMINDSGLPVIMEFNIFKYQKSRKCGSMALQYAKRYVVKTAFETEAAKRDIEKTRRKAIKKVKHYTIPALVYAEVDKCKLADDFLDNKTNQQKDKTAEQSVDTNINDLTNKQEFKYEDILSFEVITTYKKPFIPTVETDDSVTTNEPENNLKEVSQKENAQQEIVQQDVPQKAVVPTQSNDILSNETIIDYKKTPEFKNVKLDKKQVVQEKELKEENIKKAVVPKIENTEIQKQKQKNKKVKKNKKNKNTPYEIKNSKDDFYAKPLTKKEMKARNKQLKKEHSEKALKERAKKAAKNLEG